MRRAGADEISVANCDIDSPFTYRAYVESKGKNEELISEEIQAPQELVGNESGEHEKESSMRASAGVKYNAEGLSLGCEEVEPSSLAHTEKEELPANLLSNVNASSEFKKGTQRVSCFIGRYGGL